MNIITVIPLTRGKVAETLSYFTASDVPLGAIVSVPLRSKSIHAIVAETRQAEDLKLEIKRAPYEIRKLGNVKANAFFPSTFIVTAKKLAHYYAHNIGAVIDSFTADVLLDNTHRIEAPGTPQGLALSRRLNLETTTYAIQGDDEDRLSSWRSLIREEFARKKSIAIYVPTIEDAEYITKSLEKGIEEYIFTLHGSLQKKKILDVWKAISKINHPIVVVATASFALLPRPDIDTIIIERENGRGWISQKTPYMDLRHALETLAHENGQIVYRADTMLRVETLHRLDIHEINQGSPFKRRSISLAKDILIDMTKKNIGKNILSDAIHNMEKDNLEIEKTNMEKKPFRVISPELEQLICNNREESTHLFIYTARRGLSPITVCDDCETVVACANCKAPVVLHTSKNNGKNFFLCHICGERRSAEETCANCSGWRLTPLGIGIERVEQEIRAISKDIDIIKIDADSTTTKKQIDDALESFRSKPGSILLGTELAFAHLHHKIDNSAIVSLDSLLSLPDFRIGEKIMYTIIRLRSLTTKLILIQTRRPNERIFEFGLKGNLGDFYRETLADRKQFNYAPFSTLVKISIEGKKEPIAEQMATVAKLIEPFDLEIFPAFTSSARGNSVIHGLIRIEANHWPNTELIAKLKALPPNVNVRVDPESLL